MVMTKGRMVSLAEFELRSNAWNTSTLPSNRVAKAMATQATVDHLTAEPTPA
jgi:hypothetical protein